MTLRRDTDKLSLARDQWMGTPERRVRKRLYDLGGRYVPAKSGTKRRAWGGAHLSTFLLGGDALVSVPPGHVLIDPDSALGQALLDHLELPPTLSLGGGHGVRLLYRLPHGVVLRQQLRVLTDVDVILQPFVAPGSVVDGHYFRVEDESEIAELPLDIALGLQAEQGPPPRPNHVFVVKDPMAEMKARAAENRRLRALEARGRSSRSSTHRPPRAGRSMDQRRARWLAETRDGHRHQALWGLAHEALDDGETYEVYDQRVRSHPVSNKLLGKSEDWLRRCVWDRAVAVRTSRMRLRRLISYDEAGSRWVRRWRRHTAEPAARRFLEHAEQVLARQDLEAGMVEDLMDLCELQVLYAVRFGAFGALNRVDRSGAVCHFLAYSLMRAHLALRRADGRQPGGDAITRRLRRLQEVGLVVPLPRNGLIADQATYYQLKISGRSVFPPPACSASLSCPLTCGDACPKDLRVGGAAPGGGDAGPSRYREGDQGADAARAGP